MIMTMMIMTMMIMTIEKLQQGQQHTEHLQNRSSIQYERGEGVQNRLLLIENGGLYDRRAELSLL